MNSSPKAFLIDLDGVIYVQLQKKQASRAADAERFFF
jgi:hypothetical protein